MCASEFFNSSKTYPHPYEITNIISKTWILNYFVAFIGSNGYVNVCITRLPGSVRINPKTDSKSGEIQINLIKGFDRLH